MKTHTKDAGQCFDLETKPDHDAALKLLPPFDADEVKTGNLKDKDKIAEKIEEARSNHEKNWLDKAALRPETAQVVAIGYYHGDLGHEIHSIRNMNGERQLIAEFWNKMELYYSGSGKQMIGFNIFLFDLPMLVIRSRILGIRVPAGIFKGRYPDSTRFLDLRQEWLMGRNPLETKSSMDYVAKALGIEGKNGSGENFWRLLDTDEVAAYQYLYNDIRMIREIASKLGYDFNPTTSTWEEWRQKYLEAKKDDAIPAF